MKKSILDTQLNVLVNDVLTTRKLTYADYVVYHYLLNIDIKEAGLDSRSPLRGLVS